jgi:hypothetical protein
MKLDEAKCPKCGANSVKDAKPYERSFPKMQKKVVIPKVHERICVNDQCKNRWLSGEDQSKVDSALRNFLD